MRRPVPADLAPCWARRSIAAGAGLQIDLGPLPVNGWTTRAALRGTVGPVETSAGEDTSVIVTAWGFSGTQEGGLAANTLDLPADVSRDTLWVGSFDGHAAALPMEARVVLRGLDAGAYRIELFASREGTDGTNGCRDHRDRHLTVIQAETMSAAIYAGSFDPITNGHVSIIQSGLVAFDRIIVAVLSNSKKQALFSVEERIEMIADSIKGDARVEVDRFDDGLLVDYARSKGVRVVLRGLRAVGDFEHELQMANMNRHLDDGIETVFIMASDYFFVSSSLIKEAASLGGDLSGIVPELVEQKLRTKFGRIGKKRGSRT